MARRKMKLEWVVLSRHPVPGVGFPPRHAVREGRDLPLCGGPITDDTHPISGPKTLAKHPVCQRCGAHLKRMGIPY